MNGRDVMIGRELHLSTGAKPEQPDTSCLCKPGRPLIWPKGTMDTATYRKKWMEKIDAMSQIEMAALWRFAPVGHPVFCDDVLYAKFKARFASLGGMTPEVSKAIGHGGDHRG